MKTITLSDGSECEVSDEDHEYLKVFCWTHNGKAVIRRASRNRTSLMAHEIARRMGLSFSLIDHKNRMWRNNQRENLRVATKAENNRNRKPQRGSIYSSYKGVSYCLRTNKWVARITCDGRKTTIGRYTSEDEAAHAYNHWAMSLHGEFAYLNTIEP